MSRFKEPQPEFDLRNVLRGSFDPKWGRWLRGFETRRQVRDENRIRRRSLQAWLKSHAGPEERRKAQIPRGAVQSLATRLRIWKLHSFVQTFASPRYMREFRRGMSAAILRAIDQIPDAELKIFTAVPASGRVKGEDLFAFKPKRFLEQFRTQLNRQGLTDRPGWLIAFLHCEYDPRVDIFQFHIHGLAVGRKIEAVEKLKSLKAFQPDPQTVHRPIKIQPVTDRPRQISYLAQGYWPSKPTILIDGMIRRTRSRVRIPEPRHAEMLVCLDQRAFGDLFWLHGCELAGGRLQPKYDER